MAPEAALSLLLGQAISEIRRDYPTPNSGDVDVLGLGVASVISFQVCTIDFLSLDYNQSL